MAGKILSSYSPFAVFSKDDVLPVLDGRGLRIDERTPEECRPAFLKTGTISQGTGSAYAEFGNTKVLVGVYGPRETNRTSVDVGRLVCDVKVAAFATPVRGKYGQTKDDREYGVMLHRSLIGAVDVHSFPGLTVDVFALILQSGGADIAVVTTCASMALAHARVPMHDLVAATCVSYVDKELLLDPSTEEERQEDGALYLAAMSGKGSTYCLCRTCTIASMCSASSTVLIDQRSVMWNTCSRLPCCRMREVVMSDCLAGHSMLARQKENEQNYLYVAAGSLSGSQISTVIHSTICSRHQWYWDTRG